MKKIIGFLVSIIFLAVLGLWAERTYHISEYIPTIGQAANVSRNKFMKEIRGGMLNREETITVRLIGDPDHVEEITMEAINEVFNIDDPDTSDDFDYLKYHYAGMSAKIKGYGAAFTVEYEFSYLDNREQALLVNRKTASILRKLKIDSMDSYNKVKAIHDFIIENTEYDLSLKNNSAYGALIEKISACQGYAALTYKLMTDAGIPCRIISGSADGEPHAWNIVKLDHLWYNIDCTWDDPVGMYGEDHLQYDYFLKGSEDFPDHIRDKEYDSEEFHTQYPMASTGWKNE